MPKGSRHDSFKDHRPLRRQAAGSVYPKVLQKTQSEDIRRAKIEAEWERDLRTRRLK